MPSAQSKKTIDVCLSPLLFDHYDPADSIVVVIDILRATSSICVAFEYGANSIVPVLTRDESFTYKAKGYLVGAERNGEMLSGFDFGNSPFSYMDPKVKGSDIALTTTNGTRAIDAAKGAYQVVIGSFLNLDVLVQWLREQDRNIICLCSGWKNTVNMEDTIFAGALIYKLKNEFDFSINRDSAITSEYLYLLSKNDMFAFLAESSHRIRLEKLQIEEDIIYCLTPNQTSVIPVLKGDTLYNIAVMANA
jgi:2-phosphosulfolactate phosphatase